MKIETKRLLWKIWQYDMDKVKENDDDDDDEVKNMM